MVVTVAAQTARSRNRLRESMSRQRLLFIGPIRPPTGGVSVHIARLAKLLEDDFAVSFLDESRQIKDHIPNIRKISPFTYLRIIFQADVVHVHSYSGLLKLVHVLCSRIMLKRVVLTVHSVRNGDGISRLLLTMSSKLAHTVVAVSDRVGQSIRAASRIIPAFIPPAESELTTSACIAKWISEKNAEGRFVFASNAYRLERHEGKDLYGLDLIIDAFAHDSISGRCACVFIVGSPDFDPAQLQAYKNLIAQRNMEGFFLLHTHSENFSGVAALSSGTIRATSSDGDALSIRESLHLGKLTIASDAAVRPEGTLIFKSRDTQSLINTILSSIESLASSRSDAVSMQSYRDLYLRLYGTPN
jgi:hypothetical protein